MKSLTNRYLGIFTFRHKIKTLALLRQLSFERQKVIAGPQISLG